MSNELITTNQNDDKPAYLSDITKDQYGTDLLKGYLTPSFAKIIQGSTKPPLKPPFNEGDLIILPEQIRICKMGEKVPFVPIFFYPEFCLQNPFGAKTFIQEKSLDPESEIAQMCRKRRKEEREIPSDEMPGKMSEYRERLNFVVIFPTLEDIKSKIVIFSLSGGEHRSGRNLASLINGRNTPICCNIFTVWTGLHRNPMYTWVGFEFGNPESGSRFVSEKEFRMYSEEHNKMKDFYEKGLIQVNYEQENEPNVDDSEFK